MSTHGGATDAHHAPRPGHNSGFTLIEIMIVVIVLAIMAGMIVPQLSGTAYDAKVSKVKADVKSLSTCLDAYYLHLDMYPTTEQGLTALMRPPAERAEQWRGPYIVELPLDPWNGEYQYVTPGTGIHPYELWSRGADGKDGGVDAAADIHRWRQDGG